jgi:membrane-associated phospholipid phosphatase
MLRATLLAGLVAPLLPRAARPLIMLAPVSVAMTLMADSHHYLSDVLCGGLLGAAGVLFIAARADGPRPRWSTAT